jgi:hypothetical protein
LLATMREPCKAALIHAFHHNADAYSALIEHLVDRGLIPLPPPRWPNRPPRGPPNQLAASTAIWRLTVGKQAISKQPDEQMKGV